MLGPQLGGQCEYAYWHPMPGYREEHQPRSMTFVWHLVRLAAPRPVGHSGQRRRSAHVCVDLRRHGALLRLVVAERVFGNEELRPAGLEGDLVVENIAYSACGVCSSYVGPAPRPSPGCATDPRARRCPGSPDSPPAWRVGLAAPTQLRRVFLCGMRRGQPAGCGSPRR